MLTSTDFLLSVSEKKSLEQNGPFSALNEPTAVHGADRALH